MDSGRSLAQVILEMQDEIRKLESENKELRGQLRGSEQSDSLLQREGASENSMHANLRRNASAPALEGQYKDNIIMTVRRYSISTDVPRNDSSHKARSDGDTVSSSSWSKLQEGGHARPSSAFSSAAREDSTSTRDKLSNRRSLQQYVNKNRAKVKTVTFLLPVDDIYTNRPVLASRLSDRSSCDLNVIAETDS